MAITNIKVSNFKSFKDLDLNLGPFNVVIGANAAGKSNFVEIFRFLKTIEANDLADAVSLHGGPDSILNRRIAASEPLQIRMVSAQHMRWAGWTDIQVYETTYGFALRAGSAQNGLGVEAEHFTQKLRATAKDEDIEFTIAIFVSDGKRKVEITPADILEQIKDKGSYLDSASGVTAHAYMQQLSSAAEATTGNALLTRYGFFGFIGSFDSLFGRVGVYDIDPRAVKKPHERAARATLDENGENLALVLRNILSDPEKSRKFHNLVRYLLPFVAEVGTEKYLGESVLLRLREEYYEGDLLANLLSDGTVDVVALIIALFFEDKDVVIIEEPERNIHPHLISGLVTLMKDAARNKQVIITTHSPEVVRHAGVENLLLLSRDKEGFSTVSKPAEKEAVKVFLKNELGLDELFVQDVLSI